MLSVFIFSFCLLSIKPFLEKRKFISPRCFHPVMLINLNLPAESVRTLTPLLVMITLSNGTLLASVTIPFRYITLSHEHKAIPVNAQNIIFRITLICTYSFIETSAKPHIDSEIINITHWLSIVAFRCKKTFAEVSKQLKPPYVFDLFSQKQTKTMGVFHDFYQKQHRTVTVLGGFTHPKQKKYATFSRQHIFQCGPFRCPSQRK